MKQLLTLLFLALFACCCGEQNGNKTSVSSVIVTDTIQEQTADDSSALLTESKFVYRHEDSVLQALGMLCIDEIFPDVLIDIKYATADNFLGFDFYNGFNRAYIQPECIEKLRIAVKLLNDYNKGFRFVIFDAARSKEAQQLMWDSVDVPGFSKINFVANPQRGSIHNYGMALDVGIADSLGNYLDMGTPFDYFGELSFPNKTEYFYLNGKLTEVQYKNRCLLMRIMREAGFYISKTEWWHYNACSLKRAKEKFSIYKIEN